MPTPVPRETRRYLLSLYACVLGVVAAIACAAGVRLLLDDVGDPRLVILLVVLAACFALVAWVACLDFVGERRRQRARRLARRGGRYAVPDMGALPEASAAPAPPAAPPGDSLPSRRAA